MTDASPDPTRLLDLEEIRRLKYRYFRALDTKDWALVEECFTPNATAAYPQQDCGSRDEIVGFLSGAMTPDLVTMHHGHHPEIDVEGDRAAGRWYLHDKVLAPAYRFCLEGAAIYADDYVRTADGWLMSHTGYQRLYESSWSMDDLAGFRLEQGAISRGPVTSGDTPPAPPPPRGRG